VQKLAANKAAKQDEWEERSRLANQFRALEEDEVLFLDSIRERQDEEERQRAEADSEEVKSFKACVISFIHFGRTLVHSCASIGLLPHATARP
jgi:hypothetical protein